MVYKKTRINMVCKMVYDANNRDGDGDGHVRIRVHNPICVTSMYNYCKVGIRGTMGL